MIEHPIDPTAWDPATYDRFTAGMPHYTDLHAEVLANCSRLQPKRVLDLGAGTGEASSRILAAHPDAKVVALDASSAMLNVAQDRLPADRVSFIVGDLRDQLPEGTFDLIVSVLAVHHLDRGEKQNLYSMIVDRLSPGGVFVLGDLVLPSNHSSRVGRQIVAFRQRIRRVRSEPPRIQGDGADAPVDKPERIDDQLAGLAAVGLTSRLAWHDDGYAVFVATKHKRPPRVSA